MWHQQGRREDSSYGAQLNTLGYWKYPGRSSLAIPFNVGSWCRNIVAVLKCCILPLQIAYSSCGQACPLANKYIEIMANGHTLTAEVAADRAGHMCGLAFRNGLPADRGMLFAYAQEQIIGFWMKNTFIHLSIAFLDDDGRILEIHDMDPRDPSRRYISRLPARYALEVNQGWFADNSIALGDRIEFDLPASPEIFRYFVQ